MEGTSSDITKSSFFKSLRDGISTINKDVSKIEQEIKAPSERSEDKALTKLVNVAAEIKEKKASAIQIQKDLEVSNECNHRYFTHMESLVESMEGRLKNVINHLKDFGYVPPPDPKEPDPSHVANLVANANVELTNQKITNSVINKEAPVNDKNADNNANMWELKTPICLSTNVYSNLNKIATKSECLFPPTPKGYNTSSPSIPGSNFGLTDYSAISGAGSPHVENLSFNLKLNENVKIRIEGSSPELPVLTSLKETRKFGKDKIVTPEDPFPPHNREKINTPEDSITSIHNINKKKINTPDDPSTSAYNFNKNNRDTPEEPPIFHINNKHNQDTPEDPPIFHTNNKGNSPQTPKTPELTSKFRNLNF